MPIDASIPLGVQQPNTLQNLSSLVGLKTAVQGQQLQQQALQAGQMQNQQSAIDLQETQAAQQVVKDLPKYQDADGNIDYNKLAPVMAQAAPKNYARFMSSILQSQQQATVAKQSWLQAGQQQRDAVGSVAASLIDQDPQVVGKTFDAIANSPAYAHMTPALAHIQQELGPAIQSGDRGAVNGVLKRVVGMANPSSAQQPNVALVPTEGGTQPYNTNSMAPNGIGPVGNTMAPPNQIVPTTGGGIALGNPTTGTVKSFGGGGVDFPAGENRETQAELQAQRTASQQQANQAPTLHNINRNIVSLVDKGTLTGGLNSLFNTISQSTGGKMEFGNNTATDYNTLGKYLERSALTASQGMGPHTNAGLEAQVRANGSTDYTPGAIRKIATLNDALTTGNTLYQNGLEKAIGGQGGVFAKRQFDQQWANTMNPAGGVDGVQALRLKNAVDNGDKKEIQAVTQEVGGPNSPGARALLQKLKALQALSGGQQ